MRNTFIFTEQDLASYAATNRQKADARAQGIPARLLRQNAKPEPGQYERGKRSYKDIKRTIPSKFDSLAGPRGIIPGRGS